MFGLPGIKRSDPDFIPAYVANYILGGGSFSSRLMNEVREKRGLTYGISTGFAPYKEGGLWIGQVATKKASMRQTIKVLRATMKTFAAHGPTDKELADAKTYLTGSFPLAFDSNVGIASQLNVFQSEGLGVDYVKKRNSLIEAVTAADVRRAARRLLTPKKLTVVVAGTLPARNRK
jgi:zinc protease